MNKVLFTGAMSQIWLGGGWGWRGGEEQGKTHKQLYIYIYIHTERDSESKGISPHPGHTQEGHDK